MTKITQIPDLFIGNRENYLPSFAKQEGFAKAWRKMQYEASIAYKIDSLSFIEDFCHPGNLDRSSVKNIAGINHVAFYLGDYEREEQVFAFKEYLLSQDNVLSLDMGPSYISPKQYGTQGWWFSIELTDHKIIELFSCKNFGKWSTLSTSKRIHLMSHLAISISCEASVNEYLEKLSQLSPELEIIAYTEQDELGHTYGHLRNNETNRVIELVHSADITRTYLETLESEA